MSKNRLKKAAKELAVMLRNVSVSINNTPVLVNVSLDVERNDLLAVIGPNGGGKTTLLKVILGLIKPDKGEVRVFGKKPEKAHNLVGYLPQHSLFDKNYPISVFDAVLMGRYRGVFRGYSREDRLAAEEALKQVGMLEFRNRRIGSLSGGQIQRVLLARAIARNPSLLLLDEPTSSIDPEMQASFYELLARLRKKMTIILVSHDIGAISVHIDKVACLNQKLFYHGLKEQGFRELEKSYNCPIDLVAHGVPHRVLRAHTKNTRPKNKLE